VRRLRWRTAERDVARVCHVQARRHLGGPRGIDAGAGQNRTAGTQLVLHMVIRRVGIELAWALSQPERGDIEIEPSIQDVR